MHEIHVLSGACSLLLRAGHDQQAGVVEIETRPGLTLIRANHRRDPAKRVAAARAVQDREETVDLGPGIRLTIRIAVPFSEGLRAFHAMESVNVIRWDSAADGTVTVDLRCR